MSAAKPIPNNWRRDAYTWRGQGGYIGHITPRQFKRLQKKARKNNDESVNFLEILFGVKP